MNSMNTEQQQKYDDAITRLVLERNATGFPHPDGNLAVGDETVAGVVERKHLDAAARYLKSNPGHEHNNEGVSFRFED